MKNLLPFLLLFLVSSLLNAQLIDDKFIQASQKKYNTFAANRFKVIGQNLLQISKETSEIKKLNIINTWVNQIRYASDKRVYGVNDYWATLYEFIGKNMGDCEDYTITKYYILKELGVDPKRMKFTYIIYKNQRGKKIPHMVLSYLKVPRPKTTNDILVLDNNNRLVLPASKRKDIVKVVKMINGDTGPKSKKWKKLEANMRKKL